MDFCISRQKISSQLPHPLEHANASKSLRKLPVPKNIRIAQRLIDQVTDVRSKWCGVWVLICERDRGRYRTSVQPSLIVLLHKPATPQSRKYVPV